MTTAETVLQPDGDAETPPLPTIVAELARRTSAAAARADQAGKDLAGPSGLAANDLWRHEATVLAAMADLGRVVERSRAWRRSREASIVTERRAT